MATAEIVMIWGGRHKRGDAECAGLLERGTRGRRSRRMRANVAVVTQGKLPKNEKQKLLDSLDKRCRESLRTRKLGETFSGP